MGSQEDFFGGASYPAVKFEKVEDAFRGTIVGTPSVVQRKSLNPPYEMEDQLPINLDDGSGELRTLWVRKSKLSTAIREAYTATGATGLAEGGVLAVQFVSTEPPKVQGHSPAKVFRVKYTAPTASAVASADIFGD